MYQVAEENLRVSTHRPALTAAVLWKHLAEQQKEKGFSRAFYERFLVSAMPGEMDPRDLFSPFENVILKNFWVWNLLKKNLSEKNILFIEFIKEWTASFPEDREEILKLFIL